MIGMILGFAMAVEAQPIVLGVLAGPEFTRRGIVAEILERPAGVRDEEFAQRLIDAEGLRPWNGEQLNTPPEVGRMGSKAVVSSDGREIIVKYISGDQQRVGLVCRLRFSRGGVSDQRWNAYRWCASHFGLELPERPPAPIFGTDR